MKNFKVVVRKTPCFTDKRMKILTIFLKRLLFVFIFIFVWLTYEIKWLYLFNTHILPHLNISTNLWINIATWIFIITIVIQLIRNFQKKYKFNTYQKIFLTTICIIYAKYRFSGLYLYANFIKPIAYLDIIMSAALLLVITDIVCHFINSRKKHINKDTKEPYISDRPICCKKEDILDYNIEAEKLAKNLNTMILEQSWSIAITSPWGTGKTSFLNLVCNAIDTNYFIIINFNPRNAKNVQSIQKDFFSTVCAALVSYNSSFSSMFKNYMEALLLFDYNNIISKILRLQSMIDKKSAKEKISKALKHLPKKVVIIIDDFDRLLEDEIIEVFKLIDGNASFPNVIFLTAYDKNHVSKVINNKYIGEESSFSDKFFNIEITVPIRPYQKIHIYLVNEILNRIKISKEELEIYRVPLDALTGILSKYFTTLRDAKRFINLFTEEYLPLKEEVYFQDFFLLSIIKYKDPSVHKKLYNKLYFETGCIDRYELLEEKEVNKETQLPYRDILERLFPVTIDSEADEYRRIFSVSAFEIYFVIQIYDMLSKQEMQELLQKDFEFAKTQIQKWKVGNKINDFIEFLSIKNIFNFVNKNTFVSYVKIIFHLSIKYYDTEIYLLILQLIYNKNVTEINKNYKYNYDEYVDDIKKLLKESPFHSIIVKKLIINSIDGEFNNNHIIFSKDELLSINKEHLIKYIKDYDTMDDLHIALLYSCISNIVSNDRKIILDTDSCAKIKDLILKSPDYYISNFVRLGMRSSSPNYNTIACEPFWKSIFKDELSFESFINQTELDSINHIIRVRNFWKLYKNNNYTPIQIDNKNVQKLIDNNLNELMAH